MDSLVSTQWLAAHRGEVDVILDASRHLGDAGRDARAEYVAGHIPGALFLSLETFPDPASPIGRTLPGPEQAAATLGALGITRSSRVVIYDDSAIKTSARAWFILRGYGVLEVAILDGGLAKWRAEGRPLESGSAQSAPAAFPLAPFSGRVRRKHEMVANLASRAEQAVDARDPGRFTGDTTDTVHGLPGGHIPGARNLFFRDLYRADGTFRPESELRAAFAGAGVDLARPIVTTCGSGVTAAVLLFALHRLGINDGALYDGSWSEWGADPTMPRQTGPA